MAERRTVPDREKRRTVPDREKRRPVPDREKRQPVPDRESGAKADYPPLTAAEVGRYALRQIADLTGKDPEGVTGVEPLEDGWLVTVEVIEDRRIPSSTDLLATYEVELGPDGDLVSYRRVRRYARGWGDG